MGRIQAVIDPNVVAAALLTFVVVFAPLSAVIAGSRRRDRRVWLVFGAILGPVAPAILLLSPPGTCIECGARSVGWSSACVSCDAPLTGRPMVAVGPGRDRPTLRHLDGIDRTDPSRTESEPTLEGHPSLIVGATRALPASRRRSTGLRPSEPAVATGVFAGGTVPLTIGMRYVIEVADIELVIRGPVETEPASVKLTHPIEQIEATAVADRLVISDRSGQSFAIAFQSLAAVPPALFESRLRDVAGASPRAPTPRRRAVAEPVATARRTGLAATPSTATPVRQRRRQGSAETDDLEAS